jgi:uncharacterized protein (DUF1015 family)
MQARYLAASPHNLVRVILGEKFETDNESENVYTRAAKYLNDWCTSGILARDPEPALYCYRQEFIVPDTGERLMRKGFIGLGAVEDYKEGTVHRHEQTLSGPKKDRRDLLEATRAHFGQIFMLYSDPDRRVDAVLDESAHCPPTACVTDEYGTTHVLHRISDPAKIQTVHEAMSDKKLLIADGHHRYETALQFRNDHPEVEDARWVMMTFVNMDAPGLRILATHRVISGLPRFNAQTFLKRAGTRFRIFKFDTLGALTQIWEEPSLKHIRIGLVHRSTDAAYMLERERQPGELDVEVLHTELIEGALGISADDVREQKYLKYVRGMDAATDPVGSGDAQISFLLQATTIEQVAESAFSGRCMPQKSTDFYPKLLSGLTIYRLEK